MCEGAQGLGFLGLKNGLNIRGRFERPFEGMRHVRFR